MEKCRNWQEFTKYILGGDYCNAEYAQICNKTKEREERFCNGDKSKCDFYLKEKGDNKTMNTAEMWIKAQEDGMCYEATNKDGYDGSIIYQKDKGFFDEDGYQVVIETWNYPEDFMNEQWQLRTMTKSEAEAKFNIKIVGD